MSIIHSLVAAAPDDDARGCRGAEGRGGPGGGGGGHGGRGGPAGRGGGEVEVGDGEGGERRGYIMIERKDDYTSYTSLLYY